jgi:hypothetical protein
MFNGRPRKRKKMELEAPSSVNENDVISRLPRSAVGFVSKLHAEFARLSQNKNLKEFTEFVCCLLAMDPFSPASRCVFESIALDLKIPMALQMDVFAQMDTASRINNVPLAFLATSAQTLSAPDMWKKSFADLRLVVKRCATDNKTSFPAVTMSELQCEHILFSSAGKHYLRSITFPPRKSILGKVKVGESAIIAQFVDVTRQEQNIASACARLQLIQENKAWPLAPSFFANLEPEQIAAIKAVAAQRFTIITGKAGSGKSFCVKRIFDWIKSIGKTCFCISPYHKTVQRLRELGVPKVATSTSFRLAYLAQLQQHEEGTEAGLSKCSGGTCDNAGIPNKLCCPPDIVVCDEGGLQTSADYDVLFKWLLDDLSRKVVVVGDLNQMPPVTGGSPVSAVISILPHLVSNLGRVVRVGAESEALVQLASNILEGNSDIPISSKISIVEKLDASKFDFADVVITHSNDEAKTFNDLISNAHRNSLIAKGSFPQQIIYKYFKGCVLVVTKGNLNGMIGIAVSRTEIKNQGEVVPAVRISSGGEFYVVSVQDISFGYALTLNKAQGSEFKNVYVFVGGYGLSAYQNRSWMYTAVTRAKESLTFITGDRAGMKFYSSVVSRKCDDLVRTTLISEWHGKVAEIGDSDEWVPSFKLKIDDCDEKKLAGKNLAAYIDSHPFNLDSSRSAAGTATDFEAMQY